MAVPSEFEVTIRDDARRAKRSGAGTADRLLAGWM
jgi:hypothetical protein